MEKAIIYCVQGVFVSAQDHPGILCSAAGDAGAGQGEVREQSGQRQHGAERGRVEAAGRAEASNGGQRHGDAAVLCGHGGWWRAACHLRQDLGVRLSYA